MTANARAARAYGAASSLRSQKLQDADIFRRITFKLRSASDKTSIIQAVSDNRCLWQAVVMLNRDSLNPLPAPLRAQIISVGEAVLRSCNSESPDLPFMISVNEAIAAGLSGQG